MSSVRFVLLALTLCIASSLLPPAAGAQPSRLVFKDRGRDPLHGTLVSQTADTVVFDDGLTGTPDTLALADVLFIETNVGRKPKLNNVVIGMFLGMLAGMAVGASTVDECECTPGSDCLCGVGVAGPVVIGGAIGLCVGGGVGAIPTSTWEPVYLSPEARERRERLRAWP